MALPDNTFPQSGDTNYAENYAQLVGQVDLSDFVEYGLGFTVDYTTPSVDIGEGVCFVYKSSGSTSEGTSLSGLNFAVQLAPQTVSLTDSDVNHIYVDPNLGTDDSPTVVAETNTGNAPGVSLKIGEIDTTNDTKTLFNREHTLADRLKDWVNDNFYTTSESDATFVSIDEMENTWHSKQEGGTVVYGEAVPVGTFGLNDTETLEVTQAMLTQDGFTSPCVDGVALVIVVDDGSTNTIITGDGTTLYNDVTGSPLASYQNTSGSGQTVMIAIDNGSYTSGSVNSTDETAYGGYIARIN